MGMVGRQVLMVARDPHGPALVDDALEFYMAMQFMLNGFRAKGSAAALINSKNPMWPVAEFSRSHVLVPWSPDGEFLNLNLKALALIYGYPCK